jgi:hypothetical protein
MWSVVTLATRVDDQLHFDGWTICLCTTNPKMCLGPNLFSIFHWDVVATNQEKKGPLLAMISVGTY